MAALLPKFQSILTAVPMSKAFAVVGFSLALVGDRDNLLAKMVAFEERCE